MVFGNQLLQRDESNRRHSSGGKYSQGITTLGLLEKFQNLQRDLQCEPENFKGRIIFMSMYNDIEWDRKETNEKCEHNYTGKEMQPLCREYTMPRDEEGTRVRGWIRGNERFGPVLNIKVCNHDERYSIEVQVQSLLDDQNRILGSNGKRC